MSVEEQISELIDKYERETDRRDQPEADVRANYVDWLFYYLGWDAWKEDPHPTNRYHREGYHRGAGFVDVGLEVAGELVLILEAKRFGLLPHSRERKGDRTPEERQLFAYARRRRIPYGILTNFERLQVFNTDQEVLILSFDDPTEYLDHLDELQRLSPEKVKAGSLQDWERKREIKPIDKEFLTSLQDWRLHLANAIYEHNLNNLALKTDRGFDFSKLMAAVQRILDRLILIRYADDKEVLEQYDILHSIVSYYTSLGVYSGHDLLMREFIELSHSMDKNYNTTLFQPGHLCEQVFIPNEVLASIIKEMNNISFRKFTSDILGNTYETYLGRKLVLKNGEIRSEERRDIRKAGGIFYTPTMVVHYIVDNTLGQLLKELESQHRLQAIEKAQQIRVLDPACGSGSFLIYAYQVLADFYRRMNKAIENEQLKLLASVSSTDMFQRLELFKQLPQPLIDYPHHILENQLYGVDIDPEAAEIAAVNLTMQAFADTRQEKLPLILNENIKVGNSLISGAEDELHRYFGDDWQDKKPFDWEREFKDIMANGGFDIVIGNPPWAFTRDVDFGESAKRYFSDHYVGAKGKVNSYALFLWRGVNLLNSKGLFSMIIPNTFLRATTYEALRRNLLSRYCVLEITDAGSDVFAGVTASTVIPLIKKAKPFSKIEIKTLDKTGKATLINCIHTKRALENCAAVVDMYADDAFHQIADKVFATCQSLSAYIQHLISGIQTWKQHKSNFIANRPLTKDHKPLLEGKDIGRYELHFAERYILYDRKVLNVMQDESIFLLKDKILIQRVSGGGQPIKATLDRDSFYTFNSINTLVCRGLDNRYILGCLNSKFMNWLYYNKFSNRSSLTVNISARFLKQLPIRRIDFNNPTDKKMHDDLVALVDKMLGLNERLAPIRNTPSDERDELLQEIERTDTEIDQKVYELYWLTEEERQIIEASL